MIEWIHPGIFLILGALLVPVLKGPVKQAYLVALPVLALAGAVLMSPGAYGVVSFLGYDLTFGRVDRLSLVFSYIFAGMGVIGMVYALQVRDDLQHMASLIYIGSALGVVFAGDFFVLFIFWELMAFSAAFLVWSRRSRQAVDAGFRYLLVHVFGGLCLLGGIMIHMAGTGSIAFDSMMPFQGGPAFYLILLGFIINAAVPPFSAWLPDAYPEATITGAVFMTAYTTKSAVYVLARGFPGEELLMWAGAVMAVYGVFYAMLQNNMRRLLSYHIISQVGFMVCGIGIGTQLALNGAVAHAFSHILYKALLFMSAGAVMHVTGTALLSRLSGNGLYRKMPLTLALYLIGAFSISGVPLLNGFISKSMTVYAAGLEQQGIVYLMLTFASVGTFLSVALKLCWFAWFGPRTEQTDDVPGQEPPLNMLLGMGIAAFLCVLMGLYPQLLYGLLPYAADFEPYKTGKVVGTLSLLLFTALGFSVLKNRLTPKPMISLDTDWFYRKGARAFLKALNGPAARLGAGLRTLFFETIPTRLAWASRNPVALIKIWTDSLLVQFAVPEKRDEIRRRIARERELYPGDIIRHWPVGTAVLWAVLFLFAYLLISYVRTG